MTPYNKDNFSTELKDEVMVANRLQADYQKFLSKLQQKGCCDEQDRVKLLEYFDRADRIEGVIY